MKASITGRSKDEKNFPTNHEAALETVKGFEKVLINGGETKTVSFEITPEDLKFYNSDLEFVWEPGEFEIMVGTNSRDVLSTSMHWNK